MVPSKVDESKVSNMNIEKLARVTRHAMYTYLYEHPEEINQEKVEKAGQAAIMQYTHGRCHPALASTLAHLEDEIYAEANHIISSKGFLRC